MLAEARDAALGYGGRPVLTGLRFAIGTGLRVGVLGPNGGGKTTLFRGLLGELEPLDGEIRIGARTATVAQTERTRLDYPVTSTDVALMGALDGSWWRRPGREARRRALAALDKVGLGAEAGRAYGELSGGQRQRVLIARALVQQADILLLDEPFSNLDSAAGRRLTDLIGVLAAEGRTVLIATHDVEQTRDWDLVLCLNRHQVAFGAPAETLTLPVLQETYGEEIVPLPGGPAMSGILPPHHHDHDTEDGHGHG